MVRTCNGVEIRETYQSRPSYSDMGRDDKDNMQVRELKQFENLEDTRSKHSNFYYGSSPSGMTQLFFCFLTQYIIKIALKFVYKLVN